MTKGLVVVMARVGSLRRRISISEYVLYLAMITQDCWHQSTKKLGDAEAIDVVRTGTYHFLNHMRGDWNEGPEFLCAHYGLETRECA